MLKQHLKRKIQETLATKGFELRRVPRLDPLYSTDHLPTSAKILEFVGPSGGGKSTLFEQLEHILVQRWYAPHSKRFLEYTSEDEILEAHHKILAAKIRRMERDGLGVWMQSEIFIRLGKIVQQSLAGSSNAYARGFALDEGICHYFAEQIMEQERDVAYTLLKNRFLVLLLARTPDTIIQQMLERARKTTPSDALARTVKRLESDTMLRSVTAQLEIYKNLGTLAQDCGCQVLEVFSEDGITENTCRITRFERSLC